MRLNLTALIDHTAIICLFLMLYERGIIDKSDLELIEKGMRETTEMAVDGLKKYQESDPDRFESETASMRKYFDIYSAAFAQLAERPPSLLPGRRRTKTAKL